MNQKYHKLISKLEPFIVSHRDYSTHSQSLLNEKRLKSELYFNPLKTGSSSFIELLYRMDKLTFGGQGMGMPRWVMFDCAVMPGAVFGFAISKDKLSCEDLKLLGNPKSDFIPVSMYIAIPTLESGAWFGHNLSSLNSILSEDLQGLGLLTKQCAIDFLGIEKLYGATQWDSMALQIHLQIGQLKIESAYTPIHTKEMTLCYSCRPRSAVEIFSGDFKIKSNSAELFYPTTESLKELQCSIENGKAYSIISRPFVKDGKIYFDLKQS